MCVDVTAHEAEFALNCVEGDVHCFEFACLEVAAFVVVEGDVADFRKGCRTRSQEVHFDGSGDGELVRKELDFRYRYRTTEFY